MSRTQRLKGMSALAASAIATVGMAGSVLAQDDCTEESCEADQSISATLEAFGAGDLVFSQEALLSYQEALLELAEDPSPEALEEFQKAMITLGAGIDNDEILQQLFTDMRPLSDPERMAELFEEYKVTYDEGVDPERMAELFEEYKVTYDEGVDPERMAELFEMLANEDEP